MGRNFLAHREGDATNAVLAAAGYNFPRLLAWLELVLGPFLQAPGRESEAQTALKSKVHSRRISGAAMRGAAITGQVTTQRYLATTPVKSENASLNPPISKV